jgi:guanylate kinase
MMGVLLYGPPASGEDTVTSALNRLDANYRPFRRIKVGSGRTSGYRMASPSEVEAIRSRGEILWENRRYNSSYYVDQPTLLSDLSRCIPIVHLGQVQAIEAIRSAVAEARWLSVSLWCPRDIAESRIVARDTGDAVERLSAWDTTEPLDADLRINTAEVTPDDAALIIDQALRGSVTAVTCVTEVADRAAPPL